MYYSLLSISRDTKYRPLLKEHTLIPQPTLITTNKRNKHNKNVFTIDLIKQFACRQKLIL